MIDRRGHDLIAKKSVVLVSYVKKFDSKSMKQIVKKFDSKSMKLIAE